MEKVHSSLAVSLLVKPKDGRRRPSRRKVTLEKGELVQELKEPYPPDQFSAQEHNYHVFNDTAVTLNCGAIDVLPLEEAEHLYLLAVSTKDRMKEFNNEKKREYVVGLKMGDELFFKIDDDSSPGKGRIRYLGTVEHKEGVYLGVEIDEVREVISHLIFYAAILTTTQPVATVLIFCFLLLKENVHVIKIVGWMSLLAILEWFLISFSERITWCSKLG